MDFRTIKVVIGREYMTRVKKKSFLVTTFVVPVLLALLCCVPALILFFSKDKDKTIGIVDESGYVASVVTGTEKIAFTDFSGHLTMDELKEQMENLDLDAVMSITPTGEGKAFNVSVATYSKKPVSVEIKDIIGNQVEDAVEQYRLSQYEIEGLKQIIDEVKADVTVDNYTIDEDGEEKISSSEVYMFVSMILAMIIYMFIAMFSGMVMQSVIEEKTSRVVEVLVSSVKATDLMLGKIVGVACVALTQFLLWIVLTLVLVTAFNGIVGFDKLTGDPQQTQQLMQMAGGDALGIDPAAMMAAPADSAAVAAGAAPQSELQNVLGTLSNMDYGTLIICFLIFFVLGYLLYASLFAAIGSAVDNEADTQQLQLPVTVPLMLAFFVGLYAFNAPDSPLVWWCSMIPFTSPIVMLARVALGSALTWEIVLSVALLLVTFLGCAWASAKIYKVGILMFGKKSTFKDLWKWLKMK